VLYPDRLIGTVSGKEAAVEPPGMGLWRVPISLSGYKTGVCMKDKQKIVVYKGTPSKNSPNNKRLNHKPHTYFHRLYSCQPRHKSKR
ncbi:MAG: hypothetical protein KTR20_11345, partial [Cellvibrionaceae bacterium]|nr:hypothetical protein [Cellvibrionaceae bacterium]